jgi:hypothetical protein
MLVSILEETNLVQPVPPTGNLVRFLYLKIEAKLEEAIAADQLGFPPCLTVRTRTPQFWEMHPRGTVGSPPPTP